MRKNKLIALIGTLTMAAAGLAAVSAGVSSKKVESVSAEDSVRINIILEGDPTNVTKDSAKVGIETSNRYVFQTDNDFSVSSYGSGTYWNTLTAFNPAGNEGAGWSGSFTGVTANVPVSAFSNWENFGLGRYNPSNDAFWNIHSYISSVYDAVNKVKNTIVIKNDSQYMQDDKFYKVSLHDGLGDNNKTTLLVAQTGAYYPTAATVDGYTFAGWYKDSNYTSEWLNSYWVDKDVDLYAKYVPNKVDPVADYNTFYVYDYDGLISKGKGAYVFGFGEDSTIKPMTYPGVTGNSAPYAIIEEDANYDNVYRVQLSKSYKWFMIDNGYNDNVNGTTDVKDLSSNIGKVLRIGNQDWTEGSFDYGKYTTKWINYSELDIEDGYYVKIFKTGGDQLIPLEEVNSEWTGNFKVSANDTFKIVKYTGHTVYDEDWFNFDKVENKSGSAKYAEQLVSDGSSDKNIKATIDANYQIYVKPNDPDMANAIWIPQAFTVTYKNGTTTLGTTSGSAGVPIPSTDVPALPTQTGYTYTWDQNPTTYPSANTTVNAVPTANTYDVTFNGNGGSWGSDTTKVISQTYDSKYSLPSDPENSGYSFVGWFDTDSETGGNQITSDTDVKITAPQTLYARWEDSTVYRTITFSTVEDEEDRGTIDATSVIVPDGTTFKVADNQIKFDDDKNTTVTATASDPDERYSYSFYEWTYYAGKLPDVGTVNNDFTIYAKFDAQDVLYTITLDYDDGKGGSSSINNLKLDDELPVVSIPRYVGYTFNGYFTGKNGIGTKYYDKDGQPVHQLFDDPTVTTLYASWTHNLCTVTFVLPDGHPGPTPSEIKLYYNDPYTLNDPASWGGHNFDGWYTGPNGTGQKVDKTGNYPSESNLTLYAYYTLNNYAISFDTDEGTGGSLSLTSYNISNIAQTLTITDPVKYGNTPSYTINVSDTFVGDEPTISDHTVTIPAGSYGDFTVVTTWTPITPTVTIEIEGNGYVVDDDGNDVETLTVEYGDEFTFDNENGEALIGDYTIYAIDGDSTQEYKYVFKEWSIDPACESITGNVTITATFEPELRTYSLSYGGSGYTKPTSPEEGSYEYGTEIQSAPVAKKDGYNLLGWYTDAELKNKVSFPYTIRGDVTLYPEFEQIMEKVNISFDSSLGNVTVDGEVKESIKVPYGSTVEIADNYLVINDEIYIIAEAKDLSPEYDCEFTGWTGLKSGDTITEEIDLIANFTSTAKEYQLTWDFDGGTAVGPYTSGSVAYGTDITYPTDVTGKIGYTFAGWDKTLATMPAEATKITALFTANKYDVTFNANGGKFSDETTEKIISETYDSKYQLPADPSMTGYTFAGWYTEQTGGTEVTTDTDVKITSSTTLYAHWTITPELEVEQFIEYFNNQMKVCDKDGKTDEKALSTAWASLFKKNGENDYDIYSDGLGTVISENAKSMLASAKADPEGTDLQKFAFAYNYICGKYNLEDFAGRNPVVNSASRLFSVSNVSTSTWIIAATAIVGIAAVGVFFIYRKRKEN